MFNFLHQACSVEGLLNACIAALPHLPEPEKGVMIEAMREFEQFGSPSLWSPNDVDSSNELGLTEGEKREALNRYLSNHECSDVDWYAIEHNAREVLKERVPCIRVEYGREGQAPRQPYLLPVASVEAAGGDVLAALQQVAGIDPSRMVTYDADRRFNQQGEEIEPSDQDEEEIDA